MLSHSISPHLDIPKYIPDYPSSNLIPRSKLSASAPFYQAINASPVDSPTDEGRVESPQVADPSYDYSPRNSSPFSNSPIIHGQIYHNSDIQAYPHQFASASDPTQQQQQSYDINSPPPTRESDAANSYLSESPSPVDAHRSLSALPHPISAPHSQERFLHSDVTPFSAEDRIPTQTDHGSEREPCEYDLDKYPAQNAPTSLLDQRRMSEPAALGGPTLFATQTSDPSLTSRYQQFNFAYSPSNLHATRTSTPLYLSPLQRGVSTGSLRELRHHHLEYPPQPTGWKHDDSRHREHAEYYDHTGNALDEPISPMQPSFSGMVNSPTLGVPYSPMSDNFYGPSPPGTGTSTSSSAPLSAGLGSPRSISQHFQRNLSGSSDGIDRKTYSFVALPGNAVKKRPRRRYDEIERLYQCSWPDCNKSYGTLNHLNAHVTMQKHGPKRSPNEFKELRKQWRKAKKESEASAGAIRRDSYEGYDDHSGFDHRYLSSHSLHHRQHSSHHPGFGLTPSISIPHPGVSERYSIPVDDIRYPPMDRTESLTSYGSLAHRQRYSTSLPASWQAGSNMPERQAFLSSSLPSQHAHHSQLPQLAINNRLTQVPMAEHLNQLPQNSTLTTPLSSYHTSSVMPSLQGNGSMGFNTESYDMYENDSNGRPGTGHASLGHASADEYDQAQ